MKKKKANNNHSSEIRNLLPILVDQSPTPILITDTDGNIVYVNPVFSEFTGFLPDEIMGQNPRILKSGRTEKKVYKDLWKTIKAGKTWKGELCNRKKNGGIYWESIYISPLKNDKEEITHFVGVWQNITERKFEDTMLHSRVKVLERESRTDELTGIYNRRRILEELEAEVERAVRYDRDISGMMIDIDNFKQINDQYGHLAGDYVLMEFAKVVEKSVRKIDIVGRYGGDEFLLVLPESQMLIANLVAERIQKNILDHSFVVAGDPLPISASIGLISFDDIKEIDPVVFVEKVDHAMLKAKKAGKNRIFTE